MSHNSTDGNGSRASGVQDVRALVVEDNPGDAELAKLRLAESRTARFQVSWVPTLREAMDWLSQHACDVAILDLNLPDSAGLDTLEALRRAIPAVPTVVVSGAVDDELRRAAIVLDAGDVIAKDELTGALFESSVLGVLEAKRAREQRRQFERILETTPDAVLVVNREGVVQYFNAQALAFFERTREDLATERLLFAGGSSAAVELRVTRPSGEKVGEMRVVDFEWSGEPATLASIRDITQQRNLEMQLLMSDRLVSLGTLAAGVAHEINNPLAALLANVGVAMQDLASPPVGDRLADLRECLGDVREAGERIRQIVRDLKLFSRAEDDKRTRCDVRQILDSVVRMALPETQHSARVVRDYGEVAPLYASESRLSQVFLNLIVNAGQAIKPGNAEANEIRVTTRMTTDGRVAIDVRDTGPGIPREVQRRLFTPFFTTKPAGSGTGLGLPICERIVRSMGGEITFTSEVGAGTCFTVLLPATDAELEQDATPTPATPLATQRRRVLLVDDDHLLLKSLGRVLRRDHEVVSLDTGAAALALIADGQTFDLIVCDLMMPTMTGMEFDEALARLNPAQHARVVFATGGTFTPAVREFLGRTTSPFLEKPFDVELLRRLITGGPDAFAALVPPPSPVDD